MCVCMLTRVHMCRGREELSCAMGKCTCVPSVEPYCKPRVTKSGVRRDESGPEQHFLTAHSQARCQVLFYTLGSSLQVHRKDDMAEAGDEIDE